MILPGTVVSAPSGVLGFDTDVIVTPESAALFSVVQHPRLPGWTPSRELGSQDGSQAAQHAIGIGFPPGVNIWCDLEGVAPATSAEIVIDHCNAWFDAVSASGYVPGIYVGSDAILDGNALHGRLKFSHYWKSLSNVPDVAVRGYQMVQSDEHAAHGISIDNNVTQSDRLGGTVIWLAPQPPGVVT